MTDQEKITYMRENGFMDDMTPEQSQLMVDNSLALFLHEAEFVEDYEFTMILPVIRRLIMYDYKISNVLDLYLEFRRFYQKGRENFDGDTYMGVSYNAECISLFAECKARNWNWEL